MMIKRDFFGDKFFILGHRGFCEVFPENTMMSFEACAKESSVDGVELDVHLCKTGEVVVAHDFSLKRTAGLDKNIEDLTFEELSKIDVGSFKDPRFADARIPLLEDLFKTFGDRFYYDIELKVEKNKVNLELSRKVYILIEKYHLEKKVMVSSFNPFALLGFRLVSNNRIETADIFSTGDNVPKCFRQGQGRFISLSTYLKPQFCQADLEFGKKTKNIPLITWTVNTQQDAKKLLDLKERGLNIRGLIGNNPLILAETAKKYKF